jgi:hypothetical protein
LELRQKNVCAVCGGMLNVFLDMNTHKAYLACNSDQSHEGIEREPSRYEKEGLASLNLPTRREMMEQELGKEKTTRLMKYEGVVSLTKQEAMEVLRTIWPDAPDTEVLKAAMICHQYGLNPLMKHVFLIPFKRRKEGKVVGVDWATVLGINANRLIAQRPLRGRSHDYTYLDLTPRRMTDAEQEKVLGEIDDSKIWAITKLKDIATGAEVMGVGSWPKDEVPHGAEKGNTKLNMACIRSERQALDRQYPGEMPQGVEVTDERFIEGEVITPLKGGEKSGETPGEGEQREGESGETISSPTKAQKTKKIGVSTARDPATIKTINELFKACFDDFNMQPDQVIQELGYSSQSDISELPSECYQKIAAVR